MATLGCPCGFLGHPRKPCRCTPRQVQSYSARLSGPLLDRVDLHVEVPAVTARELMRGMGRDRRILPPGVNPRASTAGVTEPEAVRPAGEEPSVVIRGRVEAARAIQENRLAERPGIHCNAQMGLPEIEEFCRIDDTTRAFLQKAIESLSLSARAAHRSLRVARTIADLASADGIGLEHVAEAVQYQALDRGARVD